MDTSLNLIRIADRLAATDSHPLSANGLQRAAVLVALFERQGELVCVLIQRTDHVSHHRGQIAFPGGRLEESDPDLLSCALREAHEEVGIDPSTVEPLGDLDDVVTSSGFVVRPWVARITPARGYTVDRREVSRVIELPLDRLLDPRACTVRTIWDGTGTQPIYAIRCRRHHIWGATAAILVNLMRVVGGRLHLIETDCPDHPAPAKVAENLSPYDTKRPLTLFERSDELARSLCSWYRRVGRDLPWRRTRDPYTVWVSEVMLQQTRVESVIPYFERFIARFPTVEELALASQEEVLRYWQGLGYYSRGRNLHAAARHVVTEGGKLPQTIDGWQALPGIGRSTAGAITAISFDQPAPILDGNVRRVFSRLLALREPPSAPIAQRILWNLAELLTPVDDAAIYTQAIMELGATCCTPRQPDCAACPWQEVCGARTLGIVDTLPVPAPRAAMPHHLEVAVALRHRGTLLLQRRPQQGLLAGLWGFPRGRAEEGESLGSAAARLVADHTGRDGPTLTPLTRIKHAYSHFRITLHAYCGDLEGSRPRATKAQQWVPAVRLSDYPMPVTDLAIVEALKKLPAFDDHRPL